MTILLTSSLRLRRRAGVALIALLIGLTACNRKSVVKPEPVSSTVTTSAPKILEMIIPGLAKDSIRIDHAQKTITISLPDTLSFSTIQPSFKLSDDVSHLIYGPATDGTGETIELGTNSFTISVDRLIGCPDSCNRFTVTAKNDPDRRQAVSYKLIVKTPGPLVAQGSADPVEFFMFETPTIVLSMKNLAGSPLVMGYVLTAQGGEDSVQRTINWRRQYDAARPNQLVLPLDKGLAPATYQLYLRLVDGKLVLVPQPLIFEGPTIRLATTCTGSALLKGSGRIGLQLPGITATENIQFQLTNATGREYKLKVDRYNPQKTGLSARLSPEVEPGNYSVQVLRDGSLQGPSFALSVLSFQGQPYINTINCSVGPVLPTAAMELRRETTSYSLGVPYFFMGHSSQALIDYPYSSQARLNLISLDEPGRIDTVRVVLPRQVEMAPSFKLPPTLKPGDYYLKFQITYPGKVLESELFQRRVTVK